jgi:hypothetical protein
VNLPCSHSLCHSCVVYLNYDFYMDGIITDITYCIEDGEAYPIDYIINILAEKNPQLKAPSQRASTNSLKESEWVDMANEQQLIKENE